MADPLRIVDDLKSCQEMPPGEREAAADNLIETCGYVAAGLTAVPVPLTETVGVVATHVGMVVGLSRIYGRELNDDSARDLVTRIGATAGVSYVGARLAVGVAKLIVPVVPGLLAAPLAFASTLAIGHVAQAWLERDGELSDDAIRDLYGSAYARARDRFDPRQVRSQAPEDEEDGAT